VSLRHIHIYTVTVVTSAIQYILKHNWTKIQIIFFKYLRVTMSDTRLHFTPDRVQHWVKVPAVQTDRIWLCGIFRYILYLKIIFKNEN